MENSGEFLSDRCGTDIPIGTFAFGQEEPSIGDGAAKPLLSQDVEQRCGSTGSEYTHRAVVA
jgi:hypothetical protein